ncbi:hypothetical protein LTR85_000331 [Meristemomyces frigidus]|nr:hypothetical protein LTR85_000331 [Meristemomyces frigidus]
MDRFGRPPARGPQIHAVPDNEKAYDASGKKLPWGYDSVSSVNFADGDRTTSREPVEKGPFGRRNTTRRSGGSRSRSKTAEPERKEDAAKREQAQAEEAVFGTLGKKTGREALGEVDPNAVAQTTAVSKVEGEQEATEVLLWGFGEDLQWAAIEFYERVSGGMVLEDYDRAPPRQRGYEAARSYSRATAQKSLSRAALRKKNRYAGGEHWIKVTFDSRQAAELVCARSPHIIKGHLVCAEPYQGRGPARDDPVFASQAGAQITSDALPPSFSTHTLGASPNDSGTMSSGTEGQTPPFRSADTQALPPPPWSQPTAPPASTTVTTGRQTAGAGGAQQLTRRGSRRPIESAKTVVLLPAEQALMPKQPKQSWSAWVGASELIGTTVPRREDGTFDLDNASLYWRLFYWVDGVFGTDFCGLRGDE